MCTQMRGDALVVFEGSRRLRWEGAGAAWRLAGLWPSEPDRELLDDHLEGGRPLLVVLDRESGVVSALTEEVLRIPEGLIIRSCEAGVLDLEVPPLDWLPEPARRRGLAFARQAAMDESALPRYALPPLLVDAAPPGSPVRFAKRTAAGAGLPGSVLDSVLAELFPAAAPTSSSSPSGDRAVHVAGLPAGSGNGAIRPSPGPRVPLPTGAEAAHHR